MIDVVRVRQQISVMVAKLHQSAEAQSRQTQGAGIVKEMVKKMHNIGEAMNVLAES